MEAQDIKEIMGLVSAESHTLEYLLRIGYTEAELCALREWFYGQVMPTDHPTREQALAWFLTALPGRTETDFVGWWLAKWDEGLTGLTPARMLQREPIDD